MGSIYIIHNIKSNTIYIGATTQKPEYRLRQHRKLLISKKHDNPRLQHSFNKHGIDNFEFDVLENDINNETLYKDESFWIQYFKSIGAELYNMQHPEKIRFGIPLPEETKIKIRNTLLGKMCRMTGSLIDPNGVEYRDITNIPLFCKQHNLDDSRIRRVIKGVFNQHKGWKKLG